MRRVFLWNRVSRIKYGNLSRFLSALTLVLFLRKRFDKRVKDPCCAGKCQWSFLCCGCIVAALHDINMALRFADKLAVLHRGEIIAFCEPREVITEELLLEVYSVLAHLEELSCGAVQVVVDGVLPMTE